jgi:hypothetical protein
MLTLQNLLTRHPLRALGLALLVGIAIVLVWQFAHYTPDAPAGLSKSQQRKISADVARHQQALGVDTTKANANHAAARASLDSARQYAKQATQSHKQAARHAKRPTPATAADVHWLQRKLTDLYQ